MMHSLYRPALLLWFACNSGCGSAHFAVEWARELALTDLSHVGQRLDAPFDSPLTLQRSGESVICGNCKALLGRRSSGFAAAPERDAPAVESLAVDCLAIQALGSARAARTSFLRDLVWAPEALALLPPGLSPTISDDDLARAQTAAAAGLSWKQFDPSATASMDGGALVVSAGGMRTTLKIYGRGDFTRDGVDDLLLRVDTAALEGSYRNSRLFLLTRNATKVPLRIVGQLK